MNSLMLHVSLDEYDDLEGTGLDYLNLPSADSFRAHDLTSDLFGHFIMKLSRQKITYHDSCFEHEQLFGRWYSFHQNSQKLDRIRISARLLTIDSSCANSR